MIVVHLENQICTPQHLCLSKDSGRGDCEGSVHDARHLIHVVTIIRVIITIVIIVTVTVIVMPVVIAIVTIKKY